MLQNYHSIQIYDIYWLNWVNRDEIQETIAENRVPKDQTEMELEYESLNFRNSFLNLRFYVFSDTAVS